MVKQQVTVVNPTGLHARPASQLIALCKGFACSVKLLSGDKVCDAKSIFSVMKCAIKKGSVIDVVCDGEGEEEALKTVVAFIEGLTE